MGRVKVYETGALAKNLRETFTAKPSKKQVTLNHPWPALLQNVGDSESIMYSSDKWKEDGDLELYKHLAESRNRAFVKPGLLVHRSDPRNRVDTIGPMVSFEDVPMPAQFAVLAYFEGIELRLYTEGTNDDPEFGSGSDDGMVNVKIGHAYLAGSYIRWSSVDDRDDQPFIFIYTQADGPLILVTGDELDIIADGIVG